MIGNIRSLIVILLLPHHSVRFLKKDTIGRIFYLLIFHMFFLCYKYWDKLNKLLRTYFVIACFVLMVITSGGIYGYLSGAYQTTSTQSEFLDKQVAVIEQKQVRFKEQKTDLKNEKAALVKTISDLRVAISNPGQTQYVDKTSGQIITSTSNVAISCTNHNNFIWHYLVPMTKKIITHY